ncbi:MAG: phosphatidate cytidylyltransferase [Chloroflexi bacterium HGW-Chloroflexi-10]|nr:MAG: phosphatidate cytidylyltransferase [Chloroflexi bacterium HGW-Chloroflexi-10]
MPIWVAFLITFGTAVIWLRLIDFFVVKSWLTNQLSRKIIHVGTGPIFVLCWLLFPDLPLSRYVAAIIPLLISVQFFLVGIGGIKDTAAVEAMSRSGDPKEILKGPFIYGIVFVILTIVFWKNYPAGLISLMILCGGDGLADIVGRRVPSMPLPWSRGKTIAGTLAMFFGSVLFSSTIFWFFVQYGELQLSVDGWFVRLCIISLGATLVESIPLRDFDNLTVPSVSIILSLILF